MSIEEMLDVHTWCTPRERTLEVLYAYCTPDRTCLGVSVIKSSDGLWEVHGNLYQKGAVWRHFESRKSRDAAASVATEFALAALPVLIESVRTGRIVETPTAALAALLTESA